MPTSGHIIVALIGACVGLIGALIPIIASKDVDAAAGENLIVRGLASIVVSYIFLLAALLVSYYFLQLYFETFAASSLIVFIVAFSTYAVRKASVFNRRRKS